MFPLEFPLRILRGAPIDSVVLDVFCGRGTTNYAARNKGFVTYGIDSSRVAVAIARAKLAYATPDDVAGLARRMIEEPTPTRVPEGDFWSAAFHPTTLLAMCKIRQGLMAKGRGDRAALLRAVMLGALHGPMPIEPSNSSYFSNQMQRTYAPKPRYATEYWRRHRFKPPRIDVEAVIRRRATVVLDGLKKSASPIHNIVRGDSQSAEPYSRFNKKVTHVITSPPYYGLCTYVEDQWLRNWFLGGPDSVPYGENSHLSHRSPKEFVSSLAKVWANVAKVSAPNVKMVVRFGSIGSRSLDARELLVASFEASEAPWEIYRTTSAGSAIQGKRQANLMAASSPPKAEYDFFLRLSH